MALNGEHRCVYLRTCGLKRRGGNLSTPGTFDNLRSISGVPVLLSGDCNCEIVHVLLQGFVPSFATRSI
jgi:hypothetical protein